MLALYWWRWPDDGTAATQSWQRLELVDRLTVGCGQLGPICLSPLYLSVSLSRALS